jgi:hypothetical protein
MMLFRFILYTVLFYLLSLFVGKFIRVFQKNAKPKPQQPGPAPKQGSTYSNAVDAEFEEVPDK